MIFKNQKELKDFLLAKCKNAIVQAEEKVHQIIDGCLKQFYNEFEPDEYIRTEQLLHSLVKSEIKSDGKNGYKAEVYFDVDSLNYQNGRIETQSGYGYANWDKDTILDVVMTGSYSGLPHGGRAKGTAIWTKSQAMIGDVWKLLEQELRAQGIPIKKIK